MKFTAAYRAADGSMASETVEAADRAEAFARLRERGIEPVSLKEGGRSAGAPVRQPGTKSSGRGGLSGKKKVVAAAAVLSAAGVAYLIFTLFGPRPQESGEPAAGKRAGKPAEAAAATPETKTAQPAAEEAGKPAEQAAAKPAAPAEKPPQEANARVTDREKMLWKGKRAVRWDVQTNGVEIAETIVTDDGRRHIVSREVPGVIPTVTDQLLLMALSDTTGDGPPMPYIEATDETFRESLEIPIVLEETDTPKIREVKETLIAARAEMKELLDSGWTFRQVLDERAEQAREETEIRIKTLRAYREMVANGKPEEAERLLQDVNATLREQGRREITR